MNPSWKMIPTCSFPNSLSHSALFSSFTSFWAQSVHRKHRDGYEEAKPNITGTTRQPATFIFLIFIKNSISLHSDFITTCEGDDNRIVPANDFIASDNPVMTSVEEIPRYPNKKPMWVKIFPHRPRPRSWSKLISWTWRLSAQKINWRIEASPKNDRKIWGSCFILIFIWLIRLLLMFSSQRWSYQAPGCEPLAQNPSGSWREPKAAHRKSCGNLESQRCPKKCRLTTKDIVELCSDLKVALSGYPLLKRISYFARWIVFWSWRFHGCICC